MFLVESGIQILELMTRFLLLVCLTLLPGSWLTFGLPLEDLRIKTRLALAVSLSPGVLAVQFLALRFFDLSFADITLVLVIINLPVVYLLIRKLKLGTFPRFSLSILYGAILIVCLGIFIVLPWVVIHNYRSFNWHALLHTDIIYGIARSNYFLPEEPELAGLTLAYTWTGEIYWSVLGWLADWSPTMLYPISNLIWLVVAFILAYELAKDGFKLQSPSSLLSVGLLFTGPGFIVSMVMFVKGNLGNLDWILGVMSEFVSKYRGFEVILFANAALIGLTLLATLMLQRKIRFGEVIISGLLITLGLVYPILFPVGCFVVGGMIFLLLTKWPVELPEYRSAELLRIIVFFAISIIISAGFLVLTTRDRTGTIFQIVHSGRKAKIFHVFVTLLPFLAVLPSYLARSFCKRHGPTILMTGTALGLMGLYVFTSVYELEYKFILVSAIVLAPLAAAGIEPLLSRLASWRWLGALILPLVFGGLNMVSLFQHYPEGGLKNLAHAPNVIEESFYLELDSSNENSNWVNSVRENTPLNTIVFVRKSPIHLGPFLNRSLYFPGDIDGQATAGYSVNNQDYLLSQRGYSETIFQERREIVEMLNSNGEFVKLEHIMHKLFDLNRPLAFLFVSPYPPAVKWLEDENLGYKLYEDEKFLLWFVDVPVSSSN